MPKRGEKLEEIKIRVTKEDKALIKTVAGMKGITMTKLILDSIVPTIKRDFESIEHKEIIESRIEKTEIKIQELRDNMNSRSNTKKKKWFNVFSSQ